MARRDPNRTFSYSVVTNDYPKWTRVALSEESGQGRDTVCRTPEDVEIKLPDGSSVFADAEVSDPDGFAGVTMSVLENDELTLALRSNGAVSVKYICRAGIELLLAVGDSSS